MRRLSSCWLFFTVMASMPSWYNQWTACASGIWQRYPEQPRKGHAQLPQRVAGGGALRLQVPCQRKVHPLCGQSRFLQAEPCRPQLQLLFGGLPAALSQPVVGGPDTKKAVDIIAGKYETESSSGITYDTIRDYAEQGVDFISVGALTHSVKGLDMSFKACD